MSVMLGKPGLEHTIIRGIVTFISNPQDEQKNLKREYKRAQEEVKRIQSVPLVIGQFLEAVDQNTAIVGARINPVSCYELGSS